MNDLVDVFAVQVDEFCQFYEDGSLANVICQWISITKQKQAEEALRASEQKYRTLFELAASSIVLIDGETGAFVEFNKRTHENLGFTHEEFAKLKVADFEVMESPEQV